MSDSKAKIEKFDLKQARDRALVELDCYEPTSPEYHKIMEHVKTLSDLIDKESYEKLSPNTLAVVVGNLGIAGLLIWFERENVITTKLPAFLSKLR